jgi:hypothetical protein
MAPFAQSDANRHNIGGITGRLSPGNRVTRPTAALGSVDVHAHYARRDDISSDSAGQTQRQYPWEPPISGFENHENNSPDAEGSQPENQHVP